MVEQAKLTNVFEVIRQKIPIVECELVVDNLGAGSVYLAPIGKAFVIKGSFEVESDQNRPEFMMPPRPSHQKFIKDHKKEIDAIIRLKRIDVDGAVEVLLEDMPEWFGENPLREFNGKKLKASISHGKDGQRTTISVIGDTNAWPNSYSIGIHDSMRHVDYKGLYAPYYVYKDNVDFTWQRLVASADLDDCKITLVKAKPEKPELWLPEHST